MSIEVDFVAELAESSDAYKIEDAQNCAEDIRMEWISWCPSVDSDPDPAVLC